MVLLPVLCFIRRWRCHHRRPQHDQHARLVSCSMQPRASSQSSELSAVCLQQKTPTLHRTECDLGSCDWRPYSVYGGCLGLAVRRPRASFVADAITLTQPMQPPDYRFTKPLAQRGVGSGADPLLSLLQIRSSTVECGARHQTQRRARRQAPGAD